MTQLTLVIGNKNYSSWSLRPWLLMKQFGLQFDEIRIPLYTPNTRSQLQKYSPTGKVPVLLHGHETVWDSLAICEYLAETFPQQHYWPEDKSARIFARSISAEMHSGFEILRQNMSMNCRTKYPGKGSVPGLQEDINRITSIWQECRQKFGGNGKFLFNNFTIADAMFAPVVVRFIMYDVQVNPVSRDYVESILSLPAMQEWITAAKLETEVISEFEV